MGLKLAMHPGDTRDTEIRSSAWLEHYTDNVGVTSSNLVGSTITDDWLIS